MKPTAMKNLLLLSIPVLFVACGDGKAPSTNLPPGASGSKADKELLQRAQGLFAALPEVATSETNPITPEKVALGRMLYHDTRMSMNGTISCNSCHKLDHFGVDGERTSLGDTKERGARNSPTVYNAALHSMQFWDGRAKDVEEQAGMPVLNPVEHAMPDRIAVEKRLRDAAGYKELFASAFPSEKEPITFTSMERAIGAFERTLITPSPFDAFVKGDVTALNADAKEGLALFMDVGCTTCHMGVSLGGTMFQKFGLYADFRPLTGSTGTDHGVMDLTKKESDKDLFKVPGLRNVAKTGPYFHDGSVDDLAKAVDVMARTSLNKQLTSEETRKIVVFLESLTGTPPAEALVVPTLVAAN
ncbi:MAG TPA: cytochrome c peroxidase [Flavobacteriales bacterium]|jgi:cytochrome c peroxidase|nr:cytochrome c peroxidase [Flavobacteriales bacterium]